MAGLTDADRRHFDFVQTLLSISDTLTESETANVKLYCSHVIPNREMERLRRAVDVFHKLIELDKIDQENLDFLEELLERMGRNDLIRDVLRPYQPPDREIPENPELEPDAYLVIQGQRRIIQETVDHHRYNLRSLSRLEKSPVKFRGYKKHGMVQLGHSLEPKPEIRLKEAEVEEAQLYQISKAIAEEWARLSQELGMGKAFLDYIRRDDDMQAALQMLKAWRTKTPHGPLHYLPQLEETLQNIGRTNLAAAVQETYKEYWNGLQITELSPDTDEDKNCSLRLPGEGKYLCRRTDLGVVTPYPLHVTYRSANWSDYTWPQDQAWMAVGPLFSVQCEDVEGPVDILLPHVLHLAEDTEITKEDLQVVHVVGDSPELLPVTELTPSHAVTRFKKGSKFGVVGKREKVSSVSRDCLLVAFRSLDDSDLSTLKVYIVSNTKEMKQNLKENEKEWNFQLCDSKTCHLTPGDACYLEGSVTNGTSQEVKISPKRLVFEDTLNNNKFYEPFRVEVTADIWMDNTSRLHLELRKETTDEENKAQPLSELTLGRYKRSRAADATTQGVNIGKKSPKSRPKRKIKVEKDFQCDGAGPSGPSTHFRAQVDVTDFFENVINEVSHKWEDLARKLGFSENKIKGMRRSETDDDKRCREVLNWWRNKNGRKATLQLLKQALIDIDEGRTAENLEDHKASGESSSSSDD